MRRLFAAIALPPELRDRLALMQGGVPGARWSPPENFHITLAFLGDADDATAAEIDAALSSLRMESFSVSLRGAGVFSQGAQPEVLWAGVAPCADLTLLKEKTDNALDARGVNFARRKYSPHVTLARLENADATKLAQFLQDNSGFSAAPFEACAVVLYESRRTKDGVIYAALRSYPLHRPARAAPP